MHDLLFGTQPLTAAAWLSLFTHFTILSLLAVGGAITTVPDMQRFVVQEQGWISDAQFTASVALAQAAPGPNVLFVAVEELAQLPLEERVWRRLQLVAHGYGSRETPRRHIRLGQEVLAQMLGVSRQSVNKALKTLEAGGRLRLHYGEIELLAPNENPGSPAPAGPAAG